MNRDGIVMKRVKSEQIKLTLIEQVKCYFKYSMGSLSQTPLVSYFIGGSDIKGPYYIA